MYFILFPKHLLEKKIFVSCFIQYINVISEHNPISIQRLRFPTKRILLQIAYNVISTVRQLCLHNWDNKSDFKSYGNTIIWLFLFDELIDNSFKLWKLINFKRFFVLFLFFFKLQHLLRHFVINCTKVHKLQVNLYFWILLEEHPYFLCWLNNIKTFPSTFILQCFLKKKKKAS